MQVYLLADFKKQKKEYILDKDGNKIYDPIKRQYECNSIPLTDWNEHSKAEEWRSAWADCVNASLEQYGHSERVDHRSYERQGIDQIATIHFFWGAAASQMEKRGIATERGNLNREIEISNQHLRQLKARIGKLQNWLKEEQHSTDHPCRLYSKYLISQGTGGQIERFTIHLQPQRCF